MCDESDAFYDGVGCSNDCRTITNLYKCNLPGGTKCYPACGDGVLDNGPDNKPTTYDYSEICDEGTFKDNVGCMSTCTVIDPRYSCAVPGTACTPLCGNGVVDLNIPKNWPTVDGTFYEVCDYTSSTVEYD